MTERRCDHCGRQYEPRAPHQRYCTRRCKERAKRRSRRALERPTLTAEQVAVVESLAREGSTLETIAGSMGMSRRTFQRVRENDERVVEALERGRGDLRTELVGLLVQKARRGDIAAVIFACKSIAGLREVPEESPEQRVRVTLELPRPLDPVAYARVVRDQRSLSGGESS